MLKCKLYKFLEYYLHELVLKVHFFALFLKLFVGYLPDVNIIKALLSKEEDWLLELVLESLGFNLFKGFTVDIQKTLATLAVGNSSGSLLATKGLNRLDGFLSVSHLLRRYLHRKSLVLLGDTNVLLVLLRAHWCYLGPLSATQGHLVLLRAT